MRYWRISIDHLFSRKLGSLKPPPSSGLYMKSLSRRNFLALLGAGAAGSVYGVPFPGGSTRASNAPEFRIRTITAGVELANVDDVEQLRTAIEFLGAARERMGEQYEVQTIRVATQPFAEYQANWMNTASIDAIQRMDELAVDAGLMFNVGPILTHDVNAPGFGAWAADLIQATSNTSFSSFVASENGGMHHHTIRSAAEAIASIARTSPGGEGNFRFCATAFCPPGTPFFPAAYHGGQRAFSIGLESPLILQAALDGESNPVEFEQAMTSLLNSVLAPVEKLAEEISRETGWRYLGIDTSPAPGLEASIGRVIETVSGAPFGSPSTLAACSSITTVLKGLDVKTCGYSGLMLPVLEDRVLANRAIERRYTVSELLLYSSVCGTGLDVVPLPGDSSEQDLAATIGDVAALALRYKKPLSARLFPIPGMKEGEMVSFENPFLTTSRVMALG